jgi:GNAT superfamily N-acetyltransferase
VNSLIVDVAGPADVERWKAIRLRSLQDSPSAFGSTYAREAAFTEADWRDRLENPDSVAVLVALDGRDVGIGGAFPDLPGWLHVVAMWVDPQARGQRVAHRVLDTVRGFADQHGRRLHLDVALGNDAARASYLSYGFTPTGETRLLRVGATERVERMVLRA